MATNSARVASETKALGVEFWQSGLCPGGGVRRPTVPNPCDMLELRYKRTFSGSGTGFPSPSATLREPRSCQNSLSESIWKTSGSVAGRFMMPSRIPEIGSVATV